MVDTNKTLVWLLVVAIVVSIGSTLVTVSMLNSVDIPVMQVTGRAIDDTGEANVSLDIWAGLKVTDPTIPFGKGYFDTACSGNVAMMKSYNESHATDAWNSCWTNTTGYLVDTAGQADYHVVENNGTTVINVTMAADVTSEATTVTFFCGTGSCPQTTGTDSNVTMRTHENESSSCGANGATFGAWTEVLTKTAENTGLGLCDQLQADDNADSLQVYWGSVFQKMQIVVCTH